MDINTYLDYYYQVRYPANMTAEIQKCAKDKKETVQELENQNQLAQRQEQLIKGRIIDVFA